MRHGGDCRVVTKMVAQNHLVHLERVANDDEYPAGSCEAVTVGPSRNSSLNERRYQVMASEDQVKKVCSRQSKPRDI